MSELKTLKDIDFRADSTIILQKESTTIIALSSELKQEAIKWVKEIRKKDETKIPITDFKGDFLVKKNDQESGIIYWIKHFFDITEEDLK